MRRAVLLLLAGCAAPLRAPASYQVHLDPSLPSDASLAVVDAAEAWSAALPELRIAVTVSECVGGESDICVAEGHDLDPDHMGSTWVGSPTRTVLDLDNIAAMPPGPTPTPYLTALHELGHGMGLVHHPAGTVMSAVQNVQASWPTPDDVAQFRAR